MELQVTEHSVCEAELQVTEYSRCGVCLVPYAMVRILERHGSAGPQPLGQSHIGGVIIYWRWHILGFFFFFFFFFLFFCFVFSVIIKQ